MKCIHFGAGNIGRGLIAQLYQENNIEMVFVDVSTETINKINELKTYQIECVPSNKKITINNIKGINSITQKQELIEELKNADMITTSIGVNNIERILDNIIEALQKRTKENKLIFACFENGYLASQQMYQQVIDKDINLKNKIGYVNIIVDRLVPNQLDKNSLNVKVEDFYSVWYSKENKDFCFPFKSAIEVDNYNNFFKKKFYGVNGLHFLIALTGYHFNHKFINDTINDLKALEMINSLIDELIYPIAKLTNQSEQDIKKYLSNNVIRFANNYLKDEIERVARNAKQKLFDENERIMPIVNCLKENNKEFKTLNQLIEIGKKYIESQK